MYPTCTCLLCTLQQHLVNLCNQFVKNFFPYSIHFISSQDILSRSFQSFDACVSFFVVLRMLLLTCVIANPEEEADSAFSIHSVPFAAILALCNRSECEINASAEPKPGLKIVSSAALFLRRTYRGKNIQDTL